MADADSVNVVTREVTQQARSHYSSHPARKSPGLVVFEFWVHLVRYIWASRTLAEEACHGWPTQRDEMGTSTVKEVDARLQLRLEDHQDYPRMESPEVWEVRRGLSPSCSRLQAVGSICLPASCDLYRVDFDDTCKDIINNHPRLDGIKLLNWNPNMNMVCGNIDSLWGAFICVGPPGGHAPQPAVTKTSSIHHHHHQEHHQQKQQAYQNLPMPFPGATKWVVSPHPSRGCAVV